MVERMTTGAVYTPRVRTWVATLGLSLAVLLGAAACGGSDDDAGDGSAAPGGSGGGATPAAGQAASVGPSGTGAASGNALSVVALDKPSMAYTITGTPHPGLVSMTFDNEGDYVHEMTLLRLKDGATLDQVKAALSSPQPEQAAAQLLEDPESEITGPQVIGPHLSETVAAQLSAGHYAVICFLPAPDGMTHAQMGMVGEFTVAGAPVGSTTVDSTGRITLTDAGIDVPADFPAGGTFAVTNTGSAPHDFSLAQLKGAELGDYFQCVNASFGGQGDLAACPGGLAGGVGTLQPGQTAYLTVHLAQGSYGYVSTGGDGADFMAGLQGTFTVR